MADLSDLAAFVAVARAKGGSASALSEAVRRVETQLGVRLFNRTTRSVAPTEAGARLLERLAPVLAEVESALDVVNRLQPAKAYLTHMSHDLDHEATSKLLPPNVELAYDGLCFPF